MRTKQEIWKQIQDELEKNNANLLNRVSDSEKQVIQRFFVDNILDALVELEKLKEFVATNPEAQIELAKVLSEAKTVVNNESVDKITVG
jgi:hypothetical protein